MKNKFLAAKKAAIFSLCLATIPANAGIPVVDGLNLFQNIINVMEAITHTANQLEQIRNQLRQYQNQLQNTVTPAVYIWDQATQTMTQLRQSIDTLQYYRNQLGSIDAYLERFQDVDYYKNSPCFSGGECTPETRALLEENQRVLASESQKAANDAMFRGLDQQQNSLETDARRLQSLQTNAQGVNGQLEALGFANQFASHQSNQLLQIRALLVAQQNATATGMQANLDKESMNSAARDRFLRGSFQPSTPRSW